MEYCYRKRASSRFLQLAFPCLLSALFSGLATAGDHLPYAFKAPKGWVEFQAPSIDAAWTLAEQKELKSKTTTLMVHTHKKSTPYTFEGATADTVVAAVQKTRGALMRLSGLEGWTIDESKFEALPGDKGRRIKMKGHYRGVIDQPVEFFEWGYFVGSNYYQISLHQPGPEAAKGTSKPRRFTPAEIEQILSEFRPEGL